MNEVVALVTRGTEYKTRALYQYDYGQKLVIRGIELPESYEVHFGNSPDGVSTTAIGDSSGVAIPDIYLRSGQDVYAWLYLHTGENDGETVYRMVIPVRKRASVSNTPPTPVQQEAITQAIAALNAGVTEVQAAVSGVGTAIDAALQAAKASGEFDGAPGQDGRDGVDGKDGKDGKDGAPGADGKDGQDGAPGADGKDGADGHSPVVTASKSGTVTTISVDGTAVATINDGDPTSLIDDTAGDGVTNRTWSADKLDGAVDDLNTAIGEKYTKPETGIPASDLASGVIPSVPVQDVQVSGTSILNQGVANIPLADTDVYGVIKYSTSGSGGLMPSRTTGRMIVNSANATQIKGGTEDYRPISPANQHMAVFYGLSKAAGDSTQSSSSNAVGVYTDDAKVKIQKMLGIYEAPWELIREDSVTNDTADAVYISVDGNGNAFEITGMRLLIWTPAQETTAIIGDWGAVTLFKNNSTVMATNLYNTASSKTVNPSDSRVAGFVQVEYNGGMAMLTQYNYTNANSAQNLTMKAYVDSSQGYYPFRLNNDFGIDKIKIHSITGTISYRLYGIRKRA